MTTINQEEIQKFSKLADEWWDANGKFKPLHAFNPVRIKYIIDKCKDHFKLKKKDEPDEDPEDITPGRIGEYMGNRVDEFIDEYESALKDLVENGSELKL